MKGKLSDYYKIAGIRNEGETHVFDIEIDPSCSVFQGHFPGEPICPGVCSIQLLRECAEQILGRKMRLSAVRQCKFTALMRPEEDRRAEARIIFGEGSVPVVFQAELRSPEKTFIKLKAELSEP